MLSDQENGHSRDSVVLLFLFGLFVFFSPFTFWWAATTSVWYLPYLLWLRVIGVIAWGAHRHHHRCETRDAVSGRGRLPAGPVSDRLCGGAGLDTVFGRAPPADLCALARRLRHLLELLRQRRFRPNAGLQFSDHLPRGDARVCADTGVVDADPAADARLSAYLARRSVRFPLPQPGAGPPGGAVHAF